MLDSDVEYYTVRELDAMDLESEVENEYGGKWYRIGSGWSKMTPEEVAEHRLHGYQGTQSRENWLIKPRLYTRKELEKAEVDYTAKDYSTTWTKRVGEVWEPSNAGQRWMTSKELNVRRGTMQGPGPSIKLNADNAMLSTATAPMLSVAEIVPSGFEKEFQAIRNIVNALAGFDDSARDRILEYVMDWKEERE